MDKCTYLAVKASLVDDTELFRRLSRAHDVDVGVWRDGAIELELFVSTIPQGCVRRGEPWS